MNLNETSNFLQSGNKAHKVSQQQYLNARILVFWDMENCCIPRGADVSSIASNINLALERLNYKGPVSFHAYGNVNLLKQSKQQKLTGSGIRLFHIPPGTKDASNKHMMVDMSLWAKDHPVPANIMLISGDGDFLNTLTDLTWRGFNMLLAEPNVTNAHLREICSTTWKWDILVKGGPPDVSMPFVSRSDVEQIHSKGKEKRV